MLIRTVPCDLLPFFSAIYTHIHTLTALEKRCCLQWWVKDIKNASITQINWANGKCDSRAAEVLFTTQSHLQAEEQRLQGCENTDSSRSLYRVVGQDLTGFLSIGFKTPVSASSSFIKGNVANNTWLPTGDAWCIVTVKCYLYLKKKVNIYFYIVCVVMPKL